MKIKSLSLTLALLLGGCVPAYTLEPYAGSLRKCADIQGTYNGLFSLYIITPKAEEQFSAARSLGKYEIYAPPPKPFPPSWKPVYYKSWASYKFLDDQRLEIVLFNEIGQSVVSVIDMREEAENLSCTPELWERSYKKTSGGEGGTSRILKYSKATLVEGRKVRAEYRSQSWAGYFGLTPIKKNENSDDCYYFPKIDLALQDILTGNEKAKRAIKSFASEKCLPSEFP